jgi:hypothetical protein
LPLLSIPGELPYKSSDITGTDVLWLRAVKTNEGNKAAQAFGLPEAFTEITDAVHGVVSKVRHIGPLVMFDMI